MFYSTDLLKRKSALGTIWLAANGKKLNRGRILQVSIDESCKQIMNPEIPHALRLQAVLASGVCTVFDRQSQYLLEDIQICLSNVNAASTDLAGATTDGPILARPANINMMEEVSINADVFAAPAAFLAGSTLCGQHANRRSRRLMQDNEDLIMMPSIPDSVDDRAKSGQSARDLLQQGADPDYFVLEVMDAPVFPEGFPDADFAFPAPGEEGYPTDPYNFNEEMILPLQEEDQNVATTAAVLGNEEGKLGHTAQKESAKVTTRRHRHKKATIDDPQSITIDSAEYQAYIYGGYREDTLISRPRTMKRERPDLFSLGPATGPWPKELMYLWERCNEKCKEPFPLKTPEREGSKRGSKRVRANLGEDDLFEQEQQQQMQYGGYYHENRMTPPEQLEFPIPDDYFPPPEDYNFGGFPGGGGGGNYNNVNEEVEYEAETLRAALHGTPGAGNYKDAMFQLGLTPASDQENMMSGSHRGNHRGRFSNASLRDSRGGRLSGRSDDLGGPRLFEDILEEMQSQGGNLADALPIVGEDGGHIVVGGGGSMGGVSQFKLIEESGPSMPHTQLSGTMQQHSKTFQVLASLRSLTTTNELSLNQATYGLTRMEAAQVFSHVLVGSSKGFISVNQYEPYGDITVTFFN